MNPAFMALCVFIGYFLAWAWDEFHIADEIRFRYDLWRRWRRR